MKKTVYISGKITGLADLSKEKFNLAEEKFLKLGYNVINPHKIKLREGQAASWRNYMINDISALLKYCDTIAILDDWYDSKGALVEIFLASIFDIEAIYVDTLKPFDRNMELISKIKDA